MKRTFNTRLGVPLAAVAMFAVLLGFWACSREPASVTEAMAASLSRANQPRGGFEVWIADQSDTRPGYGGQLLIFEGTDLMGGNASRAQPTTVIDLGGATAQLCEQSTGANPVRPHMVAFNEEDSHAIISFVASGHVAVLDASSHEPIFCTRMSPGDADRIQAHAAFAAPDGSYIVVANQSGKKLERINTDFRSNTFFHDPAATIDLANCTTPLGQPCEAAGVRPLNWPICPIIDSSSRLVFTTLRGGGLFVVDATQTPMMIVGEYDMDAVHGNGCGGAEVAGHMYVNSGGSPVAVASDHEHKFGFDVYRLPLTGYPASMPNEPEARHILGKTGETDSHGMVATKNDRYVWVPDRFQNVVEIIDVAQARRVSTINLAGALSDDPSPDLLDIAPAGNRIFASLRGPTPLSGDPHNSIGSTPGLAVIQVTQNGRSGELTAVVPITNPLQQPGQDPDPHGVKVRVRKP